MKINKFRAWDESRKKMQTSVKWVEFKFSEGELIAVNYNIKGNEVVLPVMQFTGAFDSESNEMYEDDICMVEGLGYCRVSICHFYGVIFHAKDNVDWAIIDCLAEGDSFKVIGNIHQNPELLGAK